ncbi:hypothetical protein FPOAC2_05312 [Fusarium poae]|jgi:hypothetical protein
MRIPLPIIPRHKAVEFVLSSSNPQSTMGDALRASEKAIQLQQYHQRCGKHVERVSPKDALDAKLSEAQSRVHKASQLFGRESTVAVGSGGGSFTNPYLKELRSAMDDMDKLESMRATIEQEESKYQQRLEQQLEQEQANELCEHFNILGFSLCNRVFTEWLATRQVLPTPREDRVGDEDQSTRMDLVFTPISDGAQQPPAAVLSIMNNTSVTDHVHHTDMSTNDPQRSTEITTTVEDEAQEIRSQSGPARATRMARGEIVAKSLTKTTIDFDQVYQGGNPSHPYVIGEFKDRWYILECKKHNKQFRTDNPVQGAWKHLRSKRHYSDSYGVTYHMTVVELGTEVLNCNKGLSELNNEGTIIHKAKKTKNSQRILPARASQSSSTMNTHESHVSDIWPQLGEVYKTFWRSDRPRKFYAVLILPSDMNLNFSHLIPD